MFDDKKVNVLKPFAEIMHRHKDRSIFFNKITAEVLPLNSGAGYFHARRQFAGSLLIKQRRFCTNVKKKSCRNARNL